MTPRTPAASPDAVLAAAFLSGAALAALVLAVAARTWWRLMSASPTAQELSR